MAEPATRDTSLSSRKRQGTWWDRNWVWAAPLASVTLLSVVAFGLFLLAVRTYKASRPFELAWQSLTASPVVAQRLGSPLEPGWYVWGKLQRKRGEAVLNFPVSGPLGRARVHAEARARDGEWRLVDVRLYPEGRGDTLVIAAPASGSAPERKITHRHGSGRARRANLGRYRKPHPAAL